MPVLLRYIVILADEVTTEPRRLQSLLRRLLQILLFRGNDVRIVYLLWMSNLPTSSKDRQFTYPSYTLSLLLRQLSSRALPPKLLEHVCSPTHSHSNR